MIPARGGPRLNCPHCDGATKVRGNLPLSPLRVELYMACTNIFCGHTFACLLKVARTLTPSACPSPEVLIPRGDGKDRGAELPRMSARFVRANAPPVQNR